MKYIPRSDRLSRLGGSIRLKKFSRNRRWILSTRLQPRLTKARSRRRARRKIQGTIFFSNPQILGWVEMNSDRTSGLQTMCVVTISNTPLSRIASKWKSKGGLRKLNLCLIQTWSVMYHSCSAPGLPYNSPSLFPTFCMDLRGSTGVQISRGPRVT